MSDGIILRRNTYTRYPWVSVHNTTDLLTVELNFGASTGDRTIDWGDGTVEVVNTALPSHTYASGGEYVVRCYGGTTTRLGQRGRSEVNEWVKTIKAVRSWGNLGWTSFSEAFHDVSGNVEVPRYLPPSVRSLQGMFLFSSSFNQDISNWDVSSVTNMRFFVEGTNFNQDIGNWDVSKVTNADFMFNATPFNQDISGWDVSSLSRARRMFRLSSFNQDISSWDVSSLNSMENMFQNSDFNQDIGSWQLRLAGVDMSGMFDNSNMSTENYSRTLVGWANYVDANSNQPDNINLGASGLTYNDTDYAIGSTYEDAVEARAYLTGSPPAWSISDGGQV